MDKKNETAKGNTKKAADNTAGGLAAQLEAHRKPILIVSIAVIAVIVIIVAVFAIHGAVEKSNTAKLEAFVMTYKTLKSDIKPESASAAADTSKTDKTAGDNTKKVADLVSGLEKFAKGAPGGYIGAKAYLTLGDIYAAQEKWDKAEAAYEAGAKKGPKVFIAPVLLHNAGAAAEEEGKPDKAIAHYQAALKYAENGGIFAGAGRTQFAIARIEESQGKKDAAIASYQKLIDTYTTDSAWVNLAHSRLIALGGEKD
jgi:tetratricopeptide (TPR) repeat protein